MPIHRRPANLLMRCSALLALTILLASAGCTSRAVDPATLPAPGSKARAFYVAQDGKPTNDGGFDRPLDFETAISQKGPAGPGDTIWVRGGTYRGNFVSVVEGLPGQPIDVRAYPGERPTLDGAPDPAQTVLLVRGAHVTYRGFEITNSNTTRTAQTAGSNPVDRRGPGVEFYAPGSKLVGSVVHDTGTGVGVWKSAIGAEIYGNLVYYNGWRAPDRTHGHGVYVQNETDTVHLTDNIIFNQFRAGVHAFGSEDAFLNNIHLEGNTIFNNGSLSMARFHEQNILIGGGRVAENPTLVANATYHNPDKGGQNNLGYQAGCSHPTLKDNYLVGGQLLVLVKCHDVTMSGNTFVGGFDEKFPAQFPENTYETRRPQAAKVIVRPNRYEPTSAYVTVYNWPRHESVDVDLSAVLKPGTRYAVYTAEAYLEGPLLSAVYDGGAVRLPMDAGDVTAPIGVDSTPPSTSPDFQVFIVEPAVNDRWPWGTLMGALMVSGALLGVGFLKTIKPAKRQRPGAT